MVDQFEIDSQTACWKTSRHGPILLRWPKVTRSRSRLNPIFRAVTVSAGRSTKTDSLATNPPSLTPQDARPLPALRRRWRSRLATGDRPDDCNASCSATVKSHPPDRIEKRKKRNRRSSGRCLTHPPVGLPRQGQGTRSEEHTSE